MTKKLMFAVTLMFVLVFAALAADVTGKWTAQVPVRQATMERTFTFKVEGDKLTGSMSGFQGGMDIPISDGKVSGDSISFVTSFDRGGNVIKTTYTGAVAGDEIKFKMDNGRGGPPAEFVAKKAK